MATVTAQETIRFALQSLNNDILAFCRKKEDKSEVDDASEDFDVKHGREEDSPTLDIKHTKRISVGLEDLHSPESLTDSAYSPGSFQKRFVQGLSDKEKKNFEEKNKKYEYIRVWRVMGKRLVYRKKPHRFAKVLGILPKGMEFMGYERGGKDNLWTRHAKGWSCIMETTRLELIDARQTALAASLSLFEDYRQRGSKGRSLESLGNFRYRRGTRKARVPSSPRIIGMSFDMRNLDRFNLDNTNESKKEKENRLRIFQQRRKELGSSERKIIQDLLGDAIYGNSMLALVRAIEISKLIEFDDEKLISKAKAIRSSKRLTATKELHHLRRLQHVDSSISSPDIFLVKQKRKLTPLICARQICFLFDKKDRDFRLDFDEFHIFALFAKLRFSQSKSRTKRVFSTLLQDENNEDPNTIGPKQMAKGIPFNVLKYCVYRLMPPETGPLSPVQQKEKTNNFDNIKIRSWSPDDSIVRMHFGVMLTSLNSTSLGGVYFTVEHNGVILYRSERLRGDPSPKWEIFPIGHRDYLNVVGLYFQFFEVSDRRQEKLGEHTLFNKDITQMAKDGKLKQYKLLKGTATGSSVEYFLVDVPDNFFSVNQELAKQELNMAFLDDESDFEEDEASR
mmetsp:Transcript_9300/g.13955  ORF Transcript_9300/g.13955 Transcript_9300/m.13955 type:complete len:621 (-) Transcript_9300:51-1913(-)